MRHKVVKISKIHLHYSCLIHCRCVPRERELPLDVGVNLLGVLDHVVDAGQDAELEVVVCEVGVANHAAEGAGLVVELGHGVAALEGKPYPGVNIC